MPFKVAHLSNPERHILSFHVKAFGTLHSDLLFHNSILLQFADSLLNAAQGFNNVFIACGIAHSEALR